MKRKGSLKSRLIEEAFLNIDRRYFVLNELQQYCYADQPLPIGKGQTISQPTTVAYMLEWLCVQPGMEILDIGCGSGYTTALLAYIAGETGKVTGVERIPELAELAKNNLLNFKNLNYDIITAGRELGLPGRKFDRILVSAAAETFPEELLEQLNLGGKLVIPIGNAIYLYKIDAEGRVTSQSFYGFVFVPLITS
ncbi:MAG: protein-L-isoaspartate O-methyltransferase [Candidatus Cloacimonetes bacterium]|nr:protein-L-isoaspartate O-methyltransferase [Candidatus Cloacimonadota bacterium]